MPDAEPDPKPAAEGGLSRRLKFFNDIMSGVAALTGVLAVVISTITSNRINKLSQHARAADLVGNLTAKLTSQELGRDISLLALEHALNVDQTVNQSVLDKRLLARIAALLIEERPIGADAQQQQHFSSSVDRATEVLRRIIETDEPCLTSYYDYQSITSAKANQPRNAEDSSPPDAPTECRDGSAIAFKTLVRQLLGFSVASSDLVSPSQLAEIGGGDPALSTLAAGVVAQSRVLSNLSNASIDAASRRDPAAEPAKAVVVVHIDSAKPDRIEAVGRITGQLSTDRWFVVASPRVVLPTARSCGESSSVRFFHKADEALAAGMIADLERIREADARVAPLISGSGNRQPSVQAVDLSGWKYAQSVPRQNLELWLISKGKACTVSRRERQVRRQAQAAAAASPGAS